MRSLALAAMAGPVDDPEERSGVLAAARSGDLPAFEMLMRRHERLVLVTALRLSGNLPDAQAAMMGGAVPQDQALFLILTAHVIQ